MSMAPRTLLLLLLALVPGALILALGSGSQDLPWSAVWRGLAGDTGLDARIVAELRLPRALLALATGGLLALAGALMQALLRNPLADPYVLGVSGGAAAGALLALLLGGSALAQHGAALAGAVAAILGVLALAHGSGRFSPARLLLSGIILAAGWNAVVAFVLTLGEPGELRGMLFWLMGDLGFGLAPEPALAALVLGLALAWPLARPLNVLLQGETLAGALGVEVVPLQRRLFLLAALLTAVAVTHAGSIGFVGLVVPHLLRLAGLRDHRWLLPAAVLGGGALLLLADTAARTVLAPRQLPVGVLTAALGVPVFLYLLNRRGQRR